MKKSISGEYGAKGEYHKRLDKNWPYLPVYLEKMTLLRKFLENKKGIKILDVGCGEGILVDEFKAKGFDISGIDLNYSSKNVKRASLMKIPFKDGSLDLVLCLDVLEHLSFADQEKAISEIYRVVRKEGMVVFGIPNLAHFASRASFFLTGNLVRTSGIERHIGDRPINEYLNLIKKTGFKVVGRKGLFPTFPLISLMTLKVPSKSIKLHQIYNKIFQLPGICFENIIFCKK